MMTHLTRRNALKTMAGAALSSVPLGWASRSPAVGAEREAARNFLVIMVDDLRQTTRAWGDPIAITPNLDRFLGEATVFKNAFCTFPVCGPSRNAVLCGIRPSKSGLIENGPDSLRIGHSWVVTFPELLKNNGYETFGMGKIFHHDQDIEKSWTNYFHYPATTRGFQNGLEGRGLGKFTEFADHPAEDYPDGWLANTAVDVFKLASRKPFLAMVGLLKPHLPFVCPKKYWDLYDGIDLPGPAEPFFPEGMPPIENQNFYELRMYNNIPQGHEPLTPELKREIRRGYYACVSFVDAQIGRILDGLKAAGLDQSTNVILVADHGWQLGENNLWCKDELFDRSLRPVFAGRFPGFPQAPRTVERFVETIDIYPTLCAQAGIPAPYPLDGRDLTPLLKGIEAGWDDVAYAVVNRHNRMIGLTVRQGPLRYCLWLDQRTKQETAEEIYDFSLPNPEKTNLANDPGYQERKSRLRQLLQQQIAQATIFGIDLPGGRNV